MPESPSANIALLIDADNAPARKIDFIVSELASHGEVNIRRAYGNWTKSALSGWTKILQEYAIQPVQLFDMVKGKNATDMALVIDAMDMLFTKDVDTFCLVTSDCDFTPLCIRLRADGKQVIGFGGKKTPDPFINSCTRFIYLEEAPATKTARTKTAKPAASLKGNSKLMNALRNAVKAAEDEEGWAPLGPVGSHINNQSPFDHRSFGYKKLSDLFSDLDLFEVKKAENGNRPEFQVRLKKGSRKTVKRRVKGEG